MRARRAFSLVELLAVLVVIGVLIALIVPAVGGIQEKAQRTRAANNLRQIALAYQAYTQGEDIPRRVNVADIYAWAALLAEHQDLNDPALFILGEDPAVQANGGDWPRVIATRTGDNDTWVVHAGFQGFPLSLTVANNLDPQAPPNTPLAWTRGLQADGSWAPETAANPGVYGEEGGFILYVNGQVEFIEDLAANGGMLQNYTTRAPTSSIQAALSPGATILEPTIGG